MVRFRLVSSILSAPETLQTATRVAKTVVRMAKYVPRLLCTVGAHYISNPAKEASVHRTTLDPGRGAHVQLPGQLVARLRGARHGAQPQLAAHQSLQTEVSRQQDQRKATGRGGGGMADQPQA